MLVKRVATSGFGQRIDLPRREERYENVRRPAIKQYLFFILFLTLCCCEVAVAQLRLPHMLTSHMVLQRDSPIHIWGWASYSADVSISFHDQLTEVRADDLGRFSAWLPSQHQGGPYSLSVTSKGEKIVLSDVLMGDVWLASGQSNMEFPLQGWTGAPLKNAVTELAEATHPLIRLLHVARQSSSYPLEDVHGEWTSCAPATAASFSAVAYFFAREVSEREQVPIGIIDSTWGGTSADAWMSMDTLSHDANLLPAFQARAAFSNLVSEGALRRERADKSRSVGKPEPASAFYPEPSFEASHQPAFLYNGMIAPLLPLQLKGILWYQGESNADENTAPFYFTLFSALIRDWRHQFRNEELPFLFTQISSFHSSGDGWPIVRDSQRRALALRNTAMAVTLDVGEASNVHPADKQSVGHRLALTALATVYARAIHFSGPTFYKATIENSAIRVWFSHAEDLHLSPDFAGGFEIAGKDGRFVAARPTVEGSSVLLESDAVMSPQFARYGWTSVVDSFVLNADELPASTFTTAP